MILFYPQDDELETADMDSKLEVLLGAAERYKAAVLDSAARSMGGAPVSAAGKKGVIPRDIPMAFNWDGLANTLREVREMPEAAPSARLAKALKLEKLVNIYEVLRGAKMSKLEAVRLALASEVTHLRAGTPAK